MTTSSPEGRQQSDVRRDQMLVAAAELIAERGFERTRIADVAKRINTSPALVMYYFATKDEPAHRRAAALRGGLLPRRPRSSWTSPARSTSGSRSWST